MVNGSNTVLYYVSYHIFTVMVLPKNTLMSMLEELGINPLALN